MRRLVFWFDLASTYSWLSAMRIAPLAEAAGVEVVWRPFLLGPIFRAQGWETSPFNVYPAKGRHMWVDLARQAAKRGLPPPVRPEPFPARSLLACRVATALEGAARADFVRACFGAEFARGADIADPGVLAPLCGDAALAAAETPAVKAALREATGEAMARGIFGAPSFTASSMAGEALWWGDDRLEDALAAA